MISHGFVLIPDHLTFSGKSKKIKIYVFEVKHLNRLTILLSEKIMKINNGNYQNDNVSLVSYPNTFNSTNNTLGCCCG